MSVTNEDDSPETQNDHSEENYRTPMRTEITIVMLYAVVGDGCLTPMLRYNLPVLDLRVYAFKSEQSYLRTTTSKFALMST